MAVIGGGHLGRIHAKLLAAREDVEMVAVCDPFEASRREVEKSLSLPTLPSHESLEGQVDAAIIASPTTLHHALGRWCLERGIHVLIEKPIAGTVQESEDLIRIAERNERTLQVGHVERFNPVWEMAQDWISPNAIQHIEARREGPYSGRSTDIGIVLDLMIHDIDLVLSAVKSPLQSIRAMGRCVLGQHEDFAIADLVFRNGVTAHLRASRISPTPARTMEIHCHEEWVSLDFSNGTAAMTCPCDDVASGQLRADELPFEERLRVKDELFSRWLQHVETKPPSGNAIVREHDDFLDAIRRQRSPRVSGTDGGMALQVACEITYQIARQGTFEPGIIPASRLAAARRMAG